MSDQRASPATQPVVIVLHEPDDRAHADRVAEAIAPDYTALLVFQGPSDGSGTSRQQPVGPPVAMVVVVAKATMGSTRVKKAIRASADQGLPIVAVRVDPIEPEDLFDPDVAIADWVDAVPSGLEGRSGEILGAVRRSIEGADAPTGDSGPAEEAPRERPEVFICHSSEDAAQAHAIVDRLEPDIRCWIAPRDVQPGVPYLEGIIQGLDESKSVLLLMSDRAVVSPHVQREVELAVSNSTPLLPVRLSDDKPSGMFRYLIGLPQWLDAHPGPIDDHLPKIETAVRRLLDGRPPAAEPKPPPAAPRSTPPEERPPDRAPAPAPEPEPRTRGSRRQRRAGKKRRRRVVPLVLLVIAGAAAGAVALTMSGSDEDPDSLVAEQPAAQPSTADAAQQPSNDGAFLVGRRAGGVASLVRIEVDGAEQALDLASEDPRQPSVATDGTLAAIADVDGDPTLAVGPVDGPLRSIIVPGEPSEPAIAPDGRRVAYTTDAEGDDDVAVLDIASGDIRTVVGGSADEGSASWSPDGERLAVVRSGSESDTVVIVTVASGDAVALPDSVGRKSSTAWSADGSTVAFIGSGAGGHDVWVASVPDGTPAVLAATEGDESGVAWCADGWVTTTSGSGTQFVSADGGSVEQITDSGGDSHPTCLG